MVGVKSVMNIFINLKIHFKKHLKVRHAIATSSCTGAIHMGLSALGVTYDDEVIIADINWNSVGCPLSHIWAQSLYLLMFCLTLGV